ncbi:MAG: DUF881 domain-containing protein [Clostridia bacterium]|nr:DUF881 domain-containing protein [Clostridia bacterium]
MKRNHYIIIGIICFVMTVGICVQVKTVDSLNTNSGVQSMAENKLRDNVLKAKEKYEASYEKLEKSMNELESLRKTAAADNNEATSIEEKISEANKLLGLTEIKGKGVVIELDDSKLVKSNEDMNDFIVHDLDLLEVVNELFNAGAEAVSINGQRIISTTAINCSGNIVKVNDEKLGVPFEIKAIGYPDKLYGALTRPGGYLELMEDDGVSVSISKSDDISLPKYNGVYQNDYMQVAE